LAVTRYSFTSRLLCTNQWFIYYPPPLPHTCIAHTVAILLRYYCAIFDPIPTSRLYAKCHTILCIAICVQAGLPPAPRLVNPCRDYMCIYVYIYMYVCILGLPDVYINVYIRSYVFKYIYIRIHLTRSSWSAPWSQVGWDAEPKPVLSDDERSRDPYATPCSLTSSGRFGCAWKINKGHGLACNPMWWPSYVLSDFRACASVRALFPTDGVGSPDPYATPCSLASSGRFGCAREKKQRARGLTLRGDLVNPKPISPAGVGSPDPYATPCSLASSGRFGCKRREATRVNPSERSTSIWI